jgi:glycosyltransferase involved in cell wall biosynthesis
MIDEVSDIAFVARSVAEHVPGVRLLTMGRGSAESESKFREALEGSAVEYSALGILSAEDVGRILSSSDVSLFVRGGISTQRGSAIASIACSTPLVAYANQNLAAAFSEAGVVPVPLGDRERLAEATVKVLTDRELWSDLHQRSQRSYEKHFAWDAVASQFVQLFNHV